ncbi:MAG TPA: transposase [Alphaproteobacteria bacterium]|nr:transposase [Alphaproteobacteria bacterium]
MILSPVFEQFIQESPLSVMARATLEHALSASALDALFEDTAEWGYTRELLFSTTVDVMSLVVCGTVPHVQAAYKHLHGRVPVTLKSVYEKLQHIETGVSAQLVRHVAGRCQGLIGELGGACQELLPGYRVRILDGNHLAATHKRLKVTRGHRAGPLPGQSLAVLDPALMLITDIIPCEDAHTQERALLEQVLPLVQEGDVWIEDRNFCTVDFLHGVEQRRAGFVARRHGNLTVEPQGEFGPEVETDTGWVSERAVWVCRDGQRVLPMRSVRVRLKQPTQDGDVEVEILTNLPAEVADAATVASLYLKRWKIEGAFHELTMALHCELNTLGYPKAALFGFCVAVAAYNVLAVLKAALRVVHGEKKVQEEVSGYYMALEWAIVYAGMMIALPPEHWQVFGPMSSKKLANYLRDWASKVNMEKIRKAPPRKPTKHKTEPIKDKSPHLSTARLLDEAKKNRQKKKTRSNR